MTDFQNPVTIISGSYSYPQALLPELIEKLRVYLGWHPLLSDPGNQQLVSVLSLKTGDFGIRKEMVLHESAGAVGEADSAEIVRRAKEVDMDEVRKMDAEGK
jgi:hypothetical protein